MSRCKSRESQNATPFQAKYDRNGEILKQSDRESATAESAASHELRATSDELRATNQLQALGLFVHPVKRETAGWVSELEPLLFTDPKAHARGRGPETP